MSGNQLIIPESAREEDDVVQHVVQQQFIDGSREIVPEIQLTLAKRIVTPNSNKVLCLAAQTSVPVVDDETASVSNMALRLADGTNVRLSLSYFNDLTLPTNCIPLTRNIYDPNKYTVKSESSLGKVFVTFAVAAIAGLMCLSTKPNGVFYPLLHWNTPTLASSPSNPGSISKSLQSAQHGKVTAHSGAKTAKPLSKAKTEIARKPEKSNPANLVGPPVKNSAPVIVASHMPPRAPRLSRHAPSAQPKASRSYSMDRDSMLVPPPPPVMMLNTLPDANMARYIPELMNASQPMFSKAAPKTASKPKQPEGRKQFRLPPPPDPVNSYLQAPSRGAQFQIPPATDPASMMQQQELVMRPKPTHIRRVEILSAPVPGQDPNYPPLERIQYPAPDAASQ